MLNSDFMAKIYRAFSQEEGKVMAQVKPTVLSQLPIINPLHCDSSSLIKIEKISDISKKLHSLEISELEKENLHDQLNIIVNDIYIN